MSHHITPEAYYQAPTHSKKYLGSPDRLTPDQRHKLEEKRVKKLLAAGWGLKGHRFIPPIPHGPSADIKKMLKERKMERLKNKKGLPEPGTNARRILEVYLDNPGASSRIITEKYGKKYLSSISYLAAGGHLIRTGKDDGASCYRVSDEIAEQLREEVENDFPK